MYRDDIIAYLIHNQERISDMLTETKAYKEVLMMEEHAAFAPVIIDQFRDYATTVVAIEIAKSLACPTDEIYEVLDGIDLLCYIYE